MDNQFLNKAELPSEQILCALNSELKTSLNIKEKITAEDLNTHIMELERKLDSNKPNGWLYKKVYGVIANNFLQGGIEVETSFRTKFVGSVANPGIQTIQSFISFIEDVNKK